MSDIIETHRAANSSFANRSAPPLADISDTALELMPAAVYVCDRDGIVVKCNRRAIELWGRSPKLGDRAERFCGSYRLYRPDGRSLPHSECPVADVLRTGQSVREQEVVIERPDHSRIVALANIEALRDDAGAIIGAINCLVDTTELHRAKKEAAEGEARTRKILEAMPVAVYTTDDAGRITYYNTAAARLAGREPTLGSDEWCVTWKLYWPDGTPLPHDECPMALALNEGRPNSGMEAVAERPDGTRVPFLPYPTPLFDSSGRLTGAVNMLLDISERKRAETLQAEQGHLLECIATGKPFEECLSLLTSAAARLRPGTRASVLLADDARTSFDRTISANIPPSFGEGIHGAPINELMIGTCGTAIFEGRPVTCADVEHDECWSREWRELCLAHGIRAAHSTPVFGPEGKVIGSFFLCFAEAREPDDWDLSIGEFGAHVAAVAVERDRAEQALRRSEAWSVGQKEAFQAAMNGAPLERSLGILIRTAIDQAESERRCAFYIADAEGRALHHVAGMPQSYAVGVDGFPIAPESLACGLAVATGEPVITPDIYEEPLWEPWRWLAAQHDFRGCWSFPVETSSGKMVGSFAMYFREPRAPSAADRELAKALSDTAAIIISRHQEGEARGMAEAALRQSEQRLSAELSATRQLQAISTGLIRETDSEALYGKIMDAAIAIMRSDFGSMQLLYPERGNGGELRLLAFRGFDPQAAKFWEWVRADSESTCGAALRTGQRVIAADVTRCDFMAGSEDLKTYLKTGIRAVQTTPLISRSGRLLGMISTHWRKPHDPAESDLQRLDVLARQAADLIERALAEEALRDSERRLAQQVADMQGLYDFSRSLVEQDDLKVVMHGVLAAVAELLKVEKASIQLCDPSGGGLRLMNTAGFDRAIVVKITLNSDHSFARGVDGESTKIGHDPATA